AQRHLRAGIHRGAFHLCRPTVRPARRVMATTTSHPLAQHASPAVTREQIEKAIASLQPFERVMIRLLMLQYLDPNHDDVTFMARERCEPNMKAGYKFGGFATGADRKIVLPKEWITAIEHKVQQYASQV